MLVYYKCKLLCEFIRYLDTSSPTMCELWRYFYHMSNGLVSIALVGLNADRFCALTWPFWARAHLTERNTRWILVGIVLYVVPINIPTLFYYSTAKTTSNFAGVTCIVTTQFEDWYGLAAPFILSIGCMTGPAIVLLVLIILVSLKVFWALFQSSIIE